MKSLVTTLLLCVGLASAAPEQVESIAAVVDGKVILKSDVMLAVQQAQSTPSFSKLSALDQQKQVLQAMIDERVILSRAKKDSIEVTEAEVRGRVDQHIQMLASRQHMDLKTFEKVVRQQTGLTMGQYREQLATQIQEQSLMTRIRQKYIGPIEPTRKEVETFLAEYRDSLPVQYNSIRVSHIQLKIEPSQAILDSVKRLAAALIDSLDQGINWDVLTARHSQDSMASKGGDLGYFRKGLLEPEYERAAWRLDQGQYTDAPVHTRLGWHVIRIFGKKDDEIRTAQILLRTIPSAADTARYMALLDSLHAVAAAGADFAALAKKFSKDTETAWKGGSLGWMERGELDSAYQQVIAGLDPGQVSEKVKIDNDWHLFKLDESRQSRDLTLEDDYPKIEEFASNQIGNQKLKKLVERWRKEVFIEVRLGKN